MIRAIVGADGEILCMRLDDWRELQCKLGALIELERQYAMDCEMSAEALGKLDFGRLTDTAPDTSAEAPNTTPRT